MIQAYKILLLGLIALMLGVAASCGGQHKAPVKGAVPLEPKAYTLQDALAELDALVKPESVDAKVWEELKDALKEALMVEGRGLIPRRNSPESGRRGVKHPPFSQDSEIQIPEPGWSARRALKIVSTPPLGAANKVNDLTATRETNGDFTLSWHYRNIGDYNQDGVVGVSDITPLAMHYNETYDPETEPDCIQAVIDGSCNGKVGVEDVTQIAQYFGSELALYAMQGADQQQGPFTQTTTVQLTDEGRGDAKLAFAFNLGDQPAYTYWRVVPEDAEGNPGEASNVVALNVEAPVRVLGVTPLQGLAGAEVTFTAFVAGTGPFAYEWDFGGGATPNTSTAAQPIVTLNNDAVDTEYAAQVKVTGANGSATRHFTLTVTTLPGNPPVINYVGPFAGLSGEQLSFSADVSGDEPLTYSWEFDGGASPPVSAEVSPTAILGRGGTLPAPDIQYPCRLTVTNAFGSASADFTLTVSAQWHIVQGPETKNLSQFAFTSSGKLTALANGPALGGMGSPWPLYYCEWNGDSWSREYIGNRVWSQVTLSHDLNDNPVVCSLGDVLVTGCRYAFREGSLWKIEDFDEGAVGFLDYSPPMFYLDGTPVILYSSWNADFSKAYLKAAKRLGGQWSLQIVADAKRIQASAACMNSKGEPQVAAQMYYGSGHYSVDYFRAAPEGWKRETIKDITDAEGSLSLSSIAVNNDDSVIVAYGAFHLDDTTAYLAYQSGDIWTEELIDTNGTSYAMLQLVQPEELPVLSRWNSSSEEVTITFSDGVDWHSVLFPESPIIDRSSGRIIQGDTSITAISYQLEKPGFVDVRAGLYW